MLRRITHNGPHGSADTSGENGGPTTCRPEGIAAEVIDYRWELSVLTPAWVDLFAYSIGAGSQLDGTLKAVSVVK